MSQCKVCGCDDDQLAACRREVRRCQAAVDNGYPPAMWIRRLGDGAKKLEAAAAILRMQIAALESEERRRG